jgi:hypothetical protein
MVGETAEIVDAAHTAWEQIHQTPKHLQNPGPRGGQHGNVSPSIMRVVREPALYTSASAIPT